MDNEDANNELLLLDLVNDDGDTTTTTSSSSNWNKTQLLVVIMTPRITSLVSVVCACILAKRTYINRKKNIYHRLNLAMSLHIILLGCCNIYGPLASPGPIPTTTTTTSTTDSLSTSSSTTSTTTTSSFSSFSEYSNGYWWGTGYGTTTTCSVSGFFSQIGYSVSFYYVILSVYSFIAVRQNFQMEQYNYIEKYLHIAVHIFPVTSAIYLLSIQAFNDTGSGSTCWISSIPFGCGSNDIIVGGNGGNGGGGNNSSSINDDDDFISTPSNNNDMICTRGPQNIERISWLFAGLPSFFVLLFPTFMMLALYIEVKRKQQTIQLQATTVAKQAGLYLAALYLCYVFVFINKGFSIVANRQIFILQVLSGFNFNLQGVWFFCIYNYFHMKKTTKKNKQQQQRKPGENTNIDATNDDTTTKVVVERITTSMQPTTITSIGAITTTTTSSTVVDKKYRNNNESIVTTDDLDSTSNDGPVGFRDGGGGTTTVGDVGRDTTGTMSSSSSNNKNNNATIKQSIDNNGTDNRSSYTFNIFDGTNASSTFAEFVFEGDSDDEDEDQRQSNMWNTIQSHV